MILAYLVVAGFLWSLFCGRKLRSDRPGARGDA